MKKFMTWQVGLGLGLIALSATVYFIHYLIFRDAHHIFIYLVGDIAFVFLEVLMVALVIHELLIHREKQSLLHKLNMVIGVFFSEVGTHLLKTITGFMAESFQADKDLIVTKDWSEKDFYKKTKQFRDYAFPIKSEHGDLISLRDFLIEKRPLLVNLLENPNLLEHESFTDCLWAVFHLAEELSFRKDFGQLPETDYQHLSGDIQRVYRVLIVQWLSYMKHLKDDYPYLFSLAARRNPFDRNASIVIH
ncbi:MAG: hypothetical protein ABIJ41_01575 [Candidatus Omnitrophota bacterium]